MELTLLVQYSMLIKAMMEKGTSNHYLAYTYFQISNKEQTPRKVKQEEGAKIFNASIYHYRGLIEGIFGAEEIKHHQSYCRFRLKNKENRSMNLHGIIIVDMILMIGSSWLPLLLPYSRISECTIIIIDCLFIINRYQQR